jgi:hypothetical protein
MSAAAQGSEPPPSADEIMARVAVNQDAAETARESYVYRQKIAVRLRDTHGRVVREEISAYDIVPNARRTQKRLVSFSGRYWKESSMISYEKSGEGEEGGFRYEADSHLAHNLRDGLTGDHKSKDGLSKSLFPLTAKEQRKYRFALKGTENYQGNEVYRVGFEPRKPGVVSDESDDTVWKGDALISRSDLQPLLITTRLARGVPLLVRTALGTNVPGLGFSVQYQKFDDGVWFPVSYGTEFRVRVLFVYSRQITISMFNSDFRRAAVSSSVEFDTVP